MESKLCLLFLCGLLYVRIGAQERNSHCLEPPDTGICREDMQQETRYFYNPMTNTCETFQYGGCSTNSNNFLDKTSCELQCQVETCTQEPESGLCRAYMPRYFYNSTSQSCQIFIYGGCGGNSNNFETEEQCLDRCSDYTASPLEDENPFAHCFLPSAPGGCFANIPAYYYNYTIKGCVRFTYTGCDGNDNRFAEEADCVASCNGADHCLLDPESGRCKANIPRYFYNSTARACQMFFYGGCGGNPNNYDDSNACNAECGNTVPATTPKPPAYHHCFLSPEQGLCKAAIPAYFYNHTLKGCQFFTYGGCGGNENRFSSIEECTSSCNGANHCLQPAESGLCKAAIPRYFYNYEAQECQQFTYGGCGGNPNNFDDMETCENECGVGAAPGLLCSHIVLLFAGVLSLLLTTNTVY